MSFRLFNSDPPGFEIVIPWVLRGPQGTEPGFPGSGEELEDPKKKRELREPMLSLSKWRDSQGCGREEG